MASRNTSNKIEWHEGSRSSKQILCESILFGFKRGDEMSGNV